MVNKSSYSASRRSFLLLVIGMYAKTRASAKHANCSHTRSQVLNARTILARNGTSVKWGRTERIYRPLIRTGVARARHISQGTPTHAFVPLNRILIKGDWFPHPHTASSVTDTSYTFCAPAVTQRCFSLHLRLFVYFQFRLRVLRFSSKPSRPATRRAIVTHAHSSAIDLVVSEPHSGSPWDFWTDW